MIFRSALQRPLLRAAGVLIIAVLAVSAARPHTAGTTTAPLVEPYAPFRMTYMSYDSGGDTITVDLTWRSQLSWDTEVLASTKYPDMVGSYERYHHGVATSYDAMFDDLETDLTYDGSNDEFVIPAPWLIPYAFATDPGWELLGRDADGYDRFQRVLGSCAGQYREIYKRHPETGIVMEVVHVTGSESVVRAKVLTYTPLNTQPDE